MSKRRSVKEFCDTISRNDATLRLVLNLVLMISDLDVIFSVLFMNELISQGGMYLYFMGCISVGVLTYFAGVLYFGPNNKYRVIKRVCTMMTENADMFTTRTGERITVDSPIDPNAPRHGTFAELMAEEKSEEILMRFQQSLSSYGLGVCYDYAEAKVSRNVCECGHGFPFVRLAKFGFVAEPDPRDLGGILNANALYTFCTGIQQMAFGALLVLEFGATLRNTLPLSVSGVSLILTVFNVMFGFSEILSRAYQEKALADHIKSQSEVVLASKKRDATIRKEADEAEIMRTFEDRYDVVSQEDRKKMLDRLNSRYEATLQDIEDSSIKELEIQLTNYRRRMKRIKDAMSKTSSKTLTRASDDEAYYAAIKPWEEKLREIEEYYKDMASNTDFRSPDYESEIQALSLERESKLKAVKSQIEEIKDRYRTPDRNGE